MRFFLLDSDSIERATDCVSNLNESQLKRKKMNGLNNYDQSDSTIRMTSERSENPDMETNNSIACAHSRNTMNGSGHTFGGAFWLPETVAARNEPLDQRHQATTNTNTTTTTTTAAAAHKVNHRQGASHPSDNNNRCFLCDIPKQEYSLVRSYSEPICRGCLNYEGPDRIEWLISEALRFKKKDHFNYSNNNNNNIHNNHDQQTRQPRHSVEPHHQQTTPSRATDSAIEGPTKAAEHSSYQISINNSMFEARQQQQHHTTTTKANKCPSPGDSRVRAVSSHDTAPSNHDAIASAIQRQQGLQRTNEAMIAGNDIDETPEIIAVLDHHQERLINNSDNNTHPAGRAQQTDPRDGHHHHQLLATRELNNNNDDKNNNNCNSSSNNNKSQVQLDDGNYFERHENNHLPTTAAPGRATSSNIPNCCPIATQQSAPNKQLDRPDPSSLKSFHHQSNLASLLSRPTNGPASGQSSPALHAGPTKFSASHRNVGATNYGQAQMLPAQGGASGWQPGSTRDIFGGDGNGSDAVAHSFDLASNERLKNQQQQTTIEALASVPAQILRDSYEHLLRYGVVVGQLDPQQNNKTDTEALAVGQAASLQQHLNHHHQHDAHQARDLVMFGLPGANNAAAAAAAQAQLSSYFAARATAANHWPRLSAGGPNFVVGPNGSSDIKTPPNIYATGPQAHSPPSPSNLAAYMSPAAAAAAAAYCTAAQQLKSHHHHHQQQQQQATAFAASYHQHLASAGANMSSFAASNYHHSNTGQQGLNPSHTPPALAVLPLRVSSRTGMLNICNNLEKQQQQQPPIRRAAEFFSLKMSSQESASPSLRASSSELVNNQAQPNSREPDSKRARSEDGHEQSLDSLAATTKKQRQHETTTGLPIKLDDSHSDSSSSSTSSGATVMSAGGPSSEPNTNQGTALKSILAKKNPSAGGSGGGKTASLVNEDEPSNPSANCNSSTHLPGKRHVTSTMRDSNNSANAPKYQTQTSSRRLASDIRRSATNNNNNNNINDRADSAARSLAHETRDLANHRSSNTTNSTASNNQPNAAGSNCNGNQKATSAKSVAPMCCLICRARLEDRHFVQCPSVPAHKFCFACSKNSIDRQQLENKSLRKTPSDKVFCPSGKRCYLATESTPWTFMNSEIETIFRDTATQQAASFNTKRTSSSATAAAAPAAAATGGDATSQTKQTRMKHNNRHSHQQQSCETTTTTSTSNYKKTHSHHNDTSAGNNSGVGCGPNAASDTTSNPN